MSKSLRILVGASLVALLLVILVVGSALAQGRMPWRSTNTQWPGMMGGRSMMNAMQTCPWGSEADTACPGGGTAQPWNNGGVGPGWHGMRGQQGMDPTQCPMWNSSEPAGTPLTMAEALSIAEQYVADYGNDDLEVAEVMQFAENFYVEVHEISTGMGALELLIDPNTGSVYPEPGPNMMWNTKYGHMAQGGMMGYGTMGRYRQTGGDITVTADEALATAQAWLDVNMPGVVAGDEVESFYGYYTIHTLYDGEIQGMLSVNGYTGQVWYHHWHGDFVDMVEMAGEHSA